MRARLSLAWPLAMATLWLGCAGGGEPGSGVASMAKTSSPAPAASPAKAPLTSKVAITLVNEGLNPAVRSVTLDVTGVEVRTAHGPWLPLPLGELARQVDLAQYLPASLIEEEALEPGTYQEVRFHLGDRHTVAVADGSRHDLTAPPELRCSHAEFTIRKGALNRLACFVNAAQAVRETPTGSGHFTLHAHELACRSIAATGFVTGRLSTTGTRAPVAGAVVTAQTLLPGTRTARVLRTTTSGADGSYTLNLLPLGQDCWVVAQPGPGGPMHEVAVSTCLHLPATGAGSATRDLLIRPQPAGHWGRVRVASFPDPDPAHHWDEINVRQAVQVQAGAPPWHLVVARWRVTGPGPYELGPLLPGHCVVGYRKEDRLQRARMGIEDPAELLQRPVEIKPGATALLP